MYLYQDHTVRITVHVRIAHVPVQVHVPALVPAPVPAPVRVREAEEPDVLRRISIRDQVLNK